MNRTKEDITSLEEPEDVKTITVPIDPEKDKNFIEKWGLESDIDPEAGLDTDEETIEE